MEYIYQSFTGFSGVHSVEGLHDRFDAFAASNWRPAMWTVLFLLCNYVILVRGVEKGIEKMSNILMPLLFLILIIFAVHSLTLPAASEGLEFLFNPDFSKITPRVVLGAMGQAFFSLSLGLGCLITYSSYFTRKTGLMKTAFLTAGLDTLVAVLAGVIIFPAVFSFGQEPAAGPKLVFEVLPSVFANLPGSMFWSAAFFVLLFLASLTSTISMSEIQIAYFMEERNMRRSGATNLSVLIAMVLGVGCALSFGCLGNLKIGGMTLFNLFDYVSSNILLPVGGFLLSLFVGWSLKRSIIVKELLNGSDSRWQRRLVGGIVFCLRFIAPVCILAVFVYGLL